MKNFTTLFLLIISLNGFAQIGVSLVVDDLECNALSGAPTGAIYTDVDGGIEPYIYAWSNGQTVKDLIGLAAGSYAVTVTDANGETGSSTYTLIEPTPVEVTATLTEPSCHYNSGRLDGGIDITAIGGTSPYTYSWTGSNTVAADEDQWGIGQGNQEVTVTDSNGCTVAAEFYLTGPSQVIVTGVVTNLNCNAAIGPGTGAIDILPSGGQGNSESDYTYKWSTLDGSNLRPNVGDQTNLGSGTYTVTATDSNGCTGYESFSVLDPNYIDIRYELTQTECGKSNGRIELLVLGGQGDLEYHWTTDNGQITDPNSANQLDLSSGLYYLTVTDANGCSAIKDFEIVSQDLETPVELNLVRSIVCLNEPELLLSGGFPEGGYYSGDGVVGQAFNPSLVGSGSHEVIYTYVDASGCLGFSRAKIAVSDRSGCNSLEGPDICSVKADHTTGQVQILWEDPEQVDNIDGYQVHRRFYNSYNYRVIGMVNVEEENSYIDETANLDLYAYEYSLSSIDKNDNRSEYSDKHNTIHLELRVGEKGEVNLTWNDYEAVSYASVTILKGPSPEKLLEYETLSAFRNSYTDLKPCSGPQYYQLQFSSKSACDRHTPFNFKSNIENVNAQAVVQVQFYYDENQNAIKDDGERFLSFGAIKANNEKSFSNFRTEGIYLFADQGLLDIRYKEVVNPGWYTTGQAAYEYNVDAEFSGAAVAFGLYPYKLKSQLKSQLDSQRFRCGEEVEFTLSVVNYGTMSETGTVYLQLDSRIEEYGFSVEPSYEENRVVGWDVSDLYPGEIYEIDFTVRAPLIEAAEQVGEIYTFKHDIFASLESDHSYDVALRCSYDPNDKQVTPNRPDNLALKSEPLFYKIRFQNTGNDYARKVSVIDTIDKNLDLSTFKVINTSHPEELTVSFDEGHTVTFDFDNIYLPDSTTNELGSNGFISYSIEAKIDLASETEIQNTAYIYFDFNPAIITNTTESIMANAYPTVSTETLTESLITVYPNPAQSTLYVEVDAAYQFVLSDAVGKIVLIRRLEAGKNKIETHMLNNGVYYARLSSDQGVWAEKISIENN